MSYREPIFNLLHALRVASSGVTSNSVATDYPLVRVIDDQGAPLFKWSSAAAGNYIQVDRGAGTLEAVDRIIIPAGHNLNGHAWSLKTSATGSFAGEETTRVSVTQGDALIINQTFTSTTHRYVRLLVPSYQGEIGEVFLTRDRTPTRGPETDWEDDAIGLINVAEMVSGGEFLLERGSARRDLRYTYSRLASTDLAVFTDLLSYTEYGLHPFYFHPPESSEAPVLVRLVNARLNKRQDRESPRALGQSFRVDLQLREVTL